MKNKIEKLFKKYNINVNDNIINNFVLFFNALNEWNKKVNLTRIIDEDDVIIKHFLDSAYPQFLFFKNAKILDIGAGAGFPSLPLKFVREDLDITMLDSLNKRVSFLDYTINLLELKNIRAVHSRVEDFSQKEKFDFMIVRAVAVLSTLIEYALPFLKINGFLVAYKTDSVKEEIKNCSNVLNVMGGKVEKTIEYSIEENNRTIVIIKKVKSCDKKYPRGSNLPKLKPL